MLSLNRALPALRIYAKEPFRLLMLVAGIASGTALCTFVILINSTTLNALKLSIADLAGQTDLVVTSPGGESFPENTLDKVLGVKGVSNALPLVQNKAFVYLKDGSQRALTLLGVDLLNDSSVRNYGRKDGRIVPDPLAFMASNDSLALTKEFAEQNGLRIDETLKMATALGVQELKIRALVEGGDAAKAFGGTLAIMDIEAVRRLFGKQEKLDKINVVVEDKDRVVNTLTTLQNALGDGFAVLPPSAQVQSLKDVQSPFQKFLTFLGILTFVMAFFLVSNLASVSISERKREIAVLRAIGSSRKQIIGTLLFEYFIIGIFGSFGGSVLAWFVARFFSESIQRTMTSQTQVVLDLGGAMTSSLIPFIIATLGVVTTLISVLIPVYKISKMSPAEAFSPQSTCERQETFFTLIRLVQIGVGLLMALPLIFFNSVKFQILYALPLIGSFVLGPPFVVLFLAFLSRFLHQNSTPLLRLASSYVVDKPKRVETMIRGLVVGMLLIFLISSIQSAFVHALTDRFLNTSRPDFYVSSNGDFLSPLTLQSIDERLQEQLKMVQGVSGVYGQRVVPIQYQGRQIKLNAFDEVPPMTLKIPYSYFEVVDRPVAEAGYDLYHGDSNAIMVSESFKSLFGKHTGDEIEFAVLGEVKRFRIVGIVRDFTAGGGAIYLSRERYKQIWRDSLVTGIAIVLVRGAEEQSVKTEIENRFGESHGLIITLNRTIQSDVEKILKKSFSSLYIMQIASIFVAILGFLSTFLIEIQSRSVELTVLRAIGMSKWELSIFLAVEATLLGIGAGVITLILAVPVAWGMISKALGPVLGWVVTFHLEYSLCYWILLITLFVTLMSSIYAIKWACRLETSEVLNWE